MTTAIANVATTLNLGYVIASIRGKTYVWKVEILRVGPCFCQVRELGTENPVNIPVKYLHFEADQREFEDKQREVRKAA